VEREFSFVLTATDMSGAVASSEVIVKIESQDEFPPTFDRPSGYKYTIDRELPVGHIIGRVHASDEDSGPDGRVIYTMTTGADYFMVNKDTGEIFITKTLDTGILSSEMMHEKHFQEVTFVVQASTAKKDSLKSSALIIFDVRTDILPLAPLPSTQSGMAPWGQALIIALVFIVIIIGAGIFFFRKFSVNKFLQKRFMDPSLAGVNGPHYDSSVHDGAATLESTVALSQYPPQYSDIVSQYGGHSHDSGGTKQVVGRGPGGRNTQSELSEQSHRSASSGRGSAEDVEEEVDHEIQMINEGGLVSMNDTCLVEDSVSDISVQNGKEYLARLGIDTRAPHLAGLGASYQTLDSGGGGPGHMGTLGDLSSMVYSRLAETDNMSEKNSLVSGGANSVYARTGHPVSMNGSLSSIVHSEEEMAGSYNWDYLLDWGPQYQPLAHVFQEISALKDEGSGMEGDQMSGGAPSNRAPPIITCRPPRHIHAIQSTSHGPSQNTPRSPISHEMLSAASAMSPSFSPALSPLATRSPSISPLGLPGMPQRPPIHSTPGSERAVQRGVVSNIYSNHSNPPSEYAESIGGMTSGEKEMRI